MEGGEFVTPDIQFSTDPRLDRVPEVVGPILGAADFVDGEKKAQPVRSERAIRARMTIDRYPCFRDDRIIAVTVFGLVYADSEIMIAASVPCWPRWRTVHDGGSRRENF